MVMRRGCWLGTACRAMGLALHFYELLVKLSLKNILQIMGRTYGKVVECECIVVSLRLS